MGPLELVKLLIKHGADPSLKSANGHTALSIAETEGKREVADALREASLEYGNPG